ncbi:MAG: hypothetical protein AAFY56_01300 [Pseudomonadota bacterium]
MKPADEKAVLFVDVLGFAALVDENPLDVDDLVGLDRLSHHLASALAAHKNPLTSAFWWFHHSLKWALEMARMSHPVTAISFSDSAFIATDRIVQAVEIATELTKSLLRHGIPARTGIAHGTFAAVRFKSDISIDSGEHAAHFLGTGVVRAHEAEKCGVRGIRILLHPSAAALLDETAPVLELPQHEHNSSVEVRHELDYWSFNVTDGRKAWHAIQDLWDSAPDQAQVHYESTARAIDRMRVRQGFAPLKNLRRRTLPRDRA